jgi:hypothetical protein
MLTLFGFEMVSSTFEADSIEIVFRQEDVTLETQAWIDPDDPDKVCVAVLVTTGDHSTSSADFDEIMTLLSS